ncbi:uncharacterized protein LOC114539629 [Dendronephthya gigantea]|uniref:uncharacterized protein LOC114539629 n=1 Tax=Dendronephthya gigantea TaxID=151771 RepID=UPI00106B56BE|nr:uncharacterized protein LOC114539629 [Dendronephthya gigantea]
MTSFCGHADVVEPPDDDALISETSLNNARHVPELSKSPTQPSQHSHNSSVLSSETIDDFTLFRRADSKEKNKRKRAKKNPYNLSATEEELMLEFIMDNPVLWNVWNVKMTDYRRKDKKEKIWEEQTHQMNKTVDILKGWFRSLRDTHTRLEKKKSGDSAPNLTEREKFAFLKTVTRHRPEPMQSVKDTIQL